MWKRTLPLLCLAAGPLFAQDPFQPGLRWIRGATPLQAWAPLELGFAGPDALVWGAAGGANPHLFLTDAHGQGAAQASRTWDIAPGLVLTRTAAGSSGSLLALTHGTSAGATWTEVHGFDPLGPGGAAQFGPDWTHDLLPNGVSPQLKSDEGGFLLAAAQLLPNQGQVVLDVLAASTGALYSRTFLPALGLDAIEVSGDGRRIAIAAGLDVYLLDRDGFELLHLVRPASTRALALSHDGEHFAVGAPGQLDLYIDQQGIWSLDTSLPAHPDVTQASSWMPVRVALSSDGVSAAIAWWKFATGSEAAFEIWEGGLRQRRIAQPNASTGLQNLPTGAAITPNGSRAAFSTWGNGSDPEAWLLDAESAALDVAYDLPGSARSIALDGSGSRVLIGHADAHANQFSSTGAVRLYDTGERALQQLGAATLGADLHVAAKNTNASLVLFLVGQLSAPAVVPGVPGKLLLERSSLSVVAAGTDAFGRSDGWIPVPASSAFAGLSFAVQAAYRTPTGTVLGQELARPFFLE